MQKLTWSQALIKVLIHPAEVQLFVSGRFLRRKCSSEPWLRRRSRTIYIHFAAPKAGQPDDSALFPSNILGVWFSLESQGLWAYTVTRPLQLIAMQSTFSVTRLQMNSYRWAGGTQAANYVALYITRLEKKKKKLFLTPYNSSTFTQCCTN